MKKKFTLFALLFIVSTLFGQEEKGRFSGYMFGDYYHVIDHHNSDLKDKRGFQFRRIYFTYDYKIDSKFSTRLRLEMSNAGDFTSKVAMIPFVKDAYLKYKLSKDYSIIGGISSTPTFAVWESYWGYRNVEKTAIDLYKFGSSRDFGIALKGNLSQKVKLHLMLSNGSSNKQEIDKGKSAMLSVGFYPVKNLVFEIYGDFNDAEGVDNAYTYQAFVGYKSKSLRAGVSYTDQTLEVSNRDDVKKRMASGFVTASIAPKFNMLLRADFMLDPNSSGEKISFIPFDRTAKSTFFIVGLDWQVAEGVNIIPNIKFAKYSENNLGITPGNDLYGNLTFYWKFK